MATESTGGLSLPIQELATKAAEWPARARALTINSPERYSEAAQLLTGVKALLKEIDASCSPVIKAALAAHRAALAQKKQLEEPLLEAETLIKRLMAEYVRAEQFRREQEHERRLDEMIEQARAQRAQQVQALEAAGDTDLAAAVAEAPLPAQPLVEEAPPTATGISIRKIYRAEVTDFAVLVRSVHEGRCPLKVLKVDMTVLNSFARAMGPTLNWPGVTVHEDVSISARAAEE